MTTSPFPNLVEMFFRQAEQKSDAPFLWEKHDGQYQSISWKEAAWQVVALARFLRDKGVQKGDRVVLLSENRSHWGIADLGIMAAGGVTVPAYTTNTVNDHRHILNNSLAKAVIVSSQKLAKNLLPATHESGTIEFVASFEKVTLTQELSHPLYDWDQVLETAQTLDCPIREDAAMIDRERTACIIYTSGTGGAPKGVMLPHRAILHNLYGATELLKSIGLDDEVFLSFLPLSHSYEHTAGLMWPIYLGAQIYYAERLDTLQANMAECRPTLMTAVPRLYETLRARILKGLKSQSDKKVALFNKTMELGLKEIKGQRLGLFEKLQNALLSLLVRKKVRQRFGGRLKAMVSGGGPLNEDVGNFFQALGLCILQGYGQTESAPVISVNPPQKIKMRSVGPPLAQTEVKIAADGEILVHGDLVMHGYWRNEKATRESIIEGWLHTGDVGFLDDEGYLEITDRKKDIIVNSGGDNISPQRLEGLLCLAPEIAQAMVHGNNRPHLVALIIPDEEFAMSWAKDHKSGTPSMSDIVEDEAFHSVISAIVSEINKDLSNIEKIRNFVLSAEPFTIDNAQMTPTLKIRRHEILKVYYEHLEGLYSSTKR